MNDHLNVNLPIICPNMLLFLCFSLMPYGWYPLKKRTDSLLLSALLWPVGIYWFRPTQVIAKGQSFTFQTVFNWPKQKGLTPVFMTVYVCEYVNWRVTPAGSSTGSVCKPALGSSPLTQGRHERSSPDIFLQESNCDSKTRTAEALVDAARFSGVSHSISHLKTQQTSVEGTSSWWWNMTLWFMGCLLGAEDSLDV